MFDVITKKDKFDIRNENCRYFYDRFNSENQYVINKTINCFLHNGKYHVSVNKFVNPEFIEYEEKNNQNRR